MTADLNAVLAAIGARRRFLIACHVDPDPDCVGAMLALDWLLERMGKVALPLSHDPMLPQWRFLPRIERVRSAGEYTGESDDAWDALIVVDCEVERTGDAARWAGRVECVINIDHHVTNPGTGSVNLVLPEAAAAGEIVYALLQAAGVEPDRDAATLLYAAIMADTGSFRYSNTTAGVLAVASRLVEAGASPAEIAREIYDTRSWSYVRLLGRALGTLERSPGGRVAWISLTNRMLAEEGARRDETEGLIQFPRMIDGVEVAMIFRELEGGDQVRVGFRSREAVDVSALAREFGGGGHARAAGCTVRGTLDEVRQRVVRRALEAVGEAE